MELDELRQHVFLTRAFAAARPALLDIQAPGGKWLRNEERRLPDEHEYFVLRVGNTLSQLLTCCEQLEHGLHFIANYRETDAMKKAGITRAGHLRYNVENYLIRSQVLYDRALRLADAVFHLRNGEAQCTHATIVNNVKVAHTGVPKALKSLRKVLARFVEARHEIIHRGTFQDEELERIEMITILEQESEGESLDQALRNLPEVRKEWTRALISSRKRRYRRFNSTAFQAVSDLLDELSDQFDQENRRMAQLHGKHTA